MSSAYAVYDASIAALVAAILVLAAFNDLKRLRIPNVLVLALVGLFLARAPLMTLDDAAMRALRAAIMLLLGYGLFLTGRFGAGDGKLLAGMALHIPGDLVAPGLLALSLCALAAPALLGAFGAIARSGSVAAADPTVRAKEPIAARADTGPSPVDPAPAIPAVADRAEGWRAWRAWRAAGRVPFGLPIAAAGVLVLIMDAARSLTLP